MINQRGLTMKYNRNKQTINYILILTITTILLALAYSNGLFGEPTAPYFRVVFSYIFFVLIFDADNYKRIKDLFNADKAKIDIYTNKKEIARLTIFLTLVATVVFIIFYMINKAIPALIISLYILTLVMIMAYSLSIYLSQEK